MNTKTFLPLALLPSLALGGNSRTADDLVYTLYRDSSVDAGIRIHVATFDVDETDAYNRQNCERARRLFQVEPAAPFTWPGEGVRYWCERGYYSD